MSESVDNQSSAGVVEGNPRVGGIEDVENVDRIAAKLKLERLPYIEIAEKRSVDIAQAWSVESVHAQCAVEVAGADAIAARRARGAEGGRVKPFIGSCGVRCDAGSR